MTVEVPEDSPGVKSWIKWVLALALLLFGWNLWGYDLWAPDEPFFGEGAREMVADGKWVVPHVNGEINTHKPPLFFWLIALFSLPFGEVSAFTARLPSLLAALGSVALTMRLGVRTAGTRVAVLAGAILATSYMFWDKARSSQIDSLLCFLVLVAISSFEGFRKGDVDGRRAGLLFWAVAALAVLAKGPVGLLLPLGVALVTLAFDRELRRWWRFAPLSGPLVFAVLAGLWVWATSIWGEGYSVLAALKEHFIDRGLHGMHHVQPFWYYLKVLPYAFYPWSVLVPGALLLAWRRRGRPEDRFLLIWVFFVVVFFSISTEKRDLYILPAMPAFALLSARLVAAVVGWWSARKEIRGAVPGRRWVTFSLGVAGALMVLAAVAVPLGSDRGGESMTAPAMALAAVLAIGGLAVSWLAWRGETVRAVIATGSAMATVMLVTASLIFPALNGRKSGRELAGVVREQTAEARAAGRRVLGLDLGNVHRWVNFYSDGVYLEMVPDPTRLEESLAPGGENFILVNEKAWEAAPESVRGRASVLYSTRLSRRDLLLLRIEPGGSPSP